jgi:cation diffusion facilitator family transporter
VEKAQRIAIGSVALGVAVLALKAAAWRLTGSIALYSDALESVVNVAAAALAFGALRLAAKPADVNHPYGHAKAEFFAAVIEGALIVVASVLILQQAWIAWRSHHALATPGPGLALNLLATLINAGWAVVLRRAGGRARSPALLADARHLWSDVATSLGIVSGLAVAWLSGKLFLDPLLAALVAAYILWSGMRLISESVGGLMDEAPAGVIVARIRALVGGAAAGAIEAHDLRMRRAGRHSFLEFHLVVPGEMSVAEAHAICDRIEAALRGELEGLVVTIHVEPEGKAKHQGVLVL